MRAEGGEYAQAIGREEEWFEERVAKHEATDTEIESLLGMADGSASPNARQKTVCALV